MHWQHTTFNSGFDRFPKMLEKYPKVAFIGHAQTWWANIDKDHQDQSVLYPKTKVAAGGWTDRYLSDYPNLYGDLSAGSGRNALSRDEDHAREFLKRHASKLLFGSDCTDSVGQGPGLHRRRHARADPEAGARPRGAEQDPVREREEAVPPLGQITPRW